MRPLHSRRGGSYLRVADRDWADPLNGGYSRERGGRWNAPSSFGVVYLNASLRVSRANVRSRFEGQPFGVEDLRPEAGPDLVETSIPEAAFVDVVTDAGCVAVGLPATYPRRGSKVIGWKECQPIGLTAWESGELGIACRSAARGANLADEELAWLDRGKRLPLNWRKPFSEWFWPA